MDTADTFQLQAQVLRVLANEARLRIIHRLDDGECHVSELTKLTGLDPSTVSKHLALLRAHGIVGCRRNGTKVYYRLRVPCVIGFFTCAAQVLKEKPAR